MATARDGSAPHSSVHAGLFQRTFTPPASLGPYSLPREAATGIQAHLTHRKTEAGSRAADCSGSRTGDSEPWQKPRSSVLYSQHWVRARAARALSVCLLQLAPQVSLTDLTVSAHALPPPHPAPPHSHPHLVNSDPIPQLGMPPPGSPPCLQVRLAASCAHSPPCALPSA